MKIVELAFKAREREDIAPRTTKHINEWEWQWEWENHQQQSHSKASSNAHASMRYDDGMVKRITR